MENWWNRNKWTVYIILLFLIYVFVVQKERAALETKVSLYEGAQDTLKLERNKYGQQEGEIEMLVASNEKYLLDMESRDSTIIKLQSVVKDYKGKLSSASVIGVSTTSGGTTTTIITRVDTVRSPLGEVTVYPTYQTSWDTRWSKGFIIATKDTIQRQDSIRNEFEITQGFKKRNGLFKPRVPVVNIKNLNPNTVTNELRSFTLKEEQKRFSIGVGIMHGYDISTFRRTTVIGINGSFTIFRF